MSEFEMRELGDFAVALTGTTIGQAVTDTQWLVTAIGCSDGF